MESVHFLVFFIDVINIFVGQNNAYIVALQSLLR